METGTSNIRLLHKEIRDKMSILEFEKASGDIAQNVLALLESDFKGANIFLCFYPYGSEVDLIPFYQRLLEANKSLYFPITRPDDHRLDFRKIEDLSNSFNKGFKGIMEPKATLKGLDEGCKTVITITPGLVFDKQMNRIGYGGGYYDRFFESHPNFIRIAPIFSHQLESRIIVNPHDKPMDYIVTENEILKGDRL
jgi:5-formyltetrahydrofolate cyclo-ligase